MKKYFPAYVRVPLLFFAFYGIIELAVDSGDRPAFISNPYILILLAFFLFLLIVLETVGGAVKQVLFRLMTPEEREEKERLDNLPLKEHEWYKKLMKKLTKTKPIDEEHELVMNHEYDGIKELDNDLPPWWTYLFYATIIFSVVYLAKYELFGGDTQIDEYNKKMELARIQIEEYKKTAPDLLTADQVTVLTEPADIAAGQALFETNCVACHKADGGGSIGPNLTDEYWILGGSIKDIFNTIMEGGRDGKGMIAWKQQIKPSDIQKISSYIITLQGTNPPDAKAPEGDKYVQEATQEEGATTDEIPETEQDSSAE
ncbi:cbb3-type cytochrome c oxidase N-terminal domain-containing protein [Avrilella dinanensis]|uniref:Cytochrome C oxidase subunit III n=1 Tax=Avrilella dinanensis TaxID=2008672 RepID=A0A2M9R7Z2_9FLAO|nr:cbb3-type cytochrome c oxidase N-terminal domain-containing protein [Avrilella dinanensis]PJR04895.1 cytochrome C oxidase subunit III [Avrilella dinanensis]